jgi:LysR family transcriptional regulator, low CO2-responsive transcriptional regulator
LIVAIVFTQLRAFHAVAQTGGFTAAARLIGVGQPTLTIQVQELEAAYGLELFMRRGRRVALTETGAALYEITKRIMSFRDEAHDLLTASGQLERGSLRLATVGPFHATEMLAAFKQKYPGIKISTLLGSSERTLKHVVEFEADAAILAHVPDDPRVEMIPFRQHRIVVFVNGEHPWFRRKSVRMKELAGQPFILRERGSTTRRAFEAALAERDLTINPVFEIESREGVWKAVERGLGISVVADFEFVAHPNLTTLEISDAVIRTQYFIAFLKDRRHSRLIQSFVEVARELSGPRQGGRRR